MKLFIVLLLNIFCLSSFAQLSGSYTIGGNNPDYATIKDATNALSLIGISSPVVFNIRPGTYNERISSNLINGSSSINTITIQSENLDSASVIITSKLEETISVSSYFIFNQLTITNQKVHVIWGGSNVSFNNCYIYCLNKNYAIYSTADNVNFNQCNIFGDVHLPTAILTNNVMNGDISIHNLICRNNKITGSLQFSGTYVEENEIYGHLELLFKYPYAQIKKNKIYGTTYIKSAGGAKILENEFWGDISIGSSGGSQFIGNIVLGHSSWSFSDNCLISNNFFHNYVWISLSNYNKFYNNNILSDSVNFIQIDGDGNEFKNNNMPRYISGPLSSWQSSTVQNNNYFPSGGLFDSNPWYINPQYANDSDLHAHNPQLNGKGIYIPSVLIDIDNNIRQNPPSIGANEVCLIEDTINLSCGDSITLSFCSLPKNGNYIWTPNVGLSNNNILNPKASPHITTKYIVKEINSGMEDSVVIKVIPFEFNKKSDKFIKCSESTQVVLDYNASSAYLWSPTKGVGNAESYATILNPTESTNYIVTATNRCGTTTDTIKITVDPLPQAFFQYQSNGYKPIFFNRSTCATNYLWDFGDSTKSTDSIPTHTYNKTGVYLLSLIAYNLYGSDTFSYEINIMDDTGVSSLKELKTINIYPNPASNTLHIETTGLEKLTAQLYDMAGKGLTENVSFIKSININIELFSEGMYFVRVIDDIGVIIKTQKVAIVR